MQLESKVNYLNGSFQQPKRVGQTSQRRVKVKRIQEGNTELVAAISDIIQPVATIKKSKGRLDGKDEGVACQVCGDRHVHANCSPSGLGQATRRRWQNNR